MSRNFQASLLDEASTWSLTLRIKVNLGMERKTYEEGLVVKSMIPSGCML